MAGTWFSSSAFRHNVDCTCTMCTSVSSRKCKGVCMCIIRWPQPQPHIVLDVIYDITLPCMLWCDYMYYKQRGRTTWNRHWVNAASCFLGSFHWIFKTRPLYLKIGGGWKNHHRWMQWLTGWWKLKKPYKFAIKKNLTRLRWAVLCSPDFTLAWVMVCVSNHSRQIWKPAKRCQFKCCEYNTYKLWVYQCLYL